jgi:hypothetical protein
MLNTAQFMKWFIAWVHTPDGAMFSQVNLANKNILWSDAQYRQVNDNVTDQLMTLFADIITMPVVHLYLDRAHFWYVRRKDAKRAKNGLIAMATRESPIDVSF